MLKAKCRHMNPGKGVSLQGSRSPWFCAREWGGLLYFVLQSKRKEILHWLEWKASSYGCLAISDWLGLY